MTDKYPSCEERIDENYKREMDRIADALRGPEYRCMECEERFYTENGENTDRYGDPECPECYSDSDDIETVEEYPEEAREDYEQGILEFSKETVYKVLLSTGGPADGFRLWVDCDGYITRAEYFFQDWFDGAVKPVTGDDLDKLRDMFGHWVEVSDG